MSEEVLKIEKRVISVEFDGRTYKLRPPTKRKVMGYSKELKGIDKEDQDLMFEHGCKIISDAGMPEDVLDEMTIDEINQVSQALQGQKKT